ESVGTLAKLTGEKWRNLSDEDRKVRSVWPEGGPGPRSLVSLVQIPHPRAPLTPALQKYEEAAAADKARVGRLKADVSVASYPKLLRVPIAQTSKAKGGKQGEVALDAQMFPFARLRRVVAGDPDIHAVSREAVLALGKSVEAFLTALAASAARTAQRRGAKRTVTEADVASTARSVLPFSTVLGVGDFPPERSWGDSAGASTTHERHGAEKSAVAPLARTEGAMGRFMASTGALSREAAFAAAATSAAKGGSGVGGSGEPGSP
ncbi:HAP5, partial [Symbiodinium sp. KB8]